MGARPLNRFRGLSAPRLPSFRVVRRWVVALLVVSIALAAVYFLWFRDSSLVAVERVEVRGAEGDPNVEAALTRAAEGMSTLDVDEAVLEQAVAGDPSVLSVSASPDFPHGLIVEVDSREPAAYIPGDGAIVAADGVVLEIGAEAPDGLPAIDGDEGGAGAEGSRLEGAALALARILGAVPGPLQDLAVNGRMDEEHGPTVEIGEGIDVRFGDPAQADRKWAAAAAVLADPSLRSATYIDVSVPARPVVG